MRSSRAGQAIEFLGVDLTDRHARQPRPIDVCNLQRTRAGRLAATFWAWHWPASATQALDVAAIADEIGRARATMVDGPQALADLGQTMRACERACGAVGKTPAALPEPGRPFAGFVRSSVELFAALRASGVPISPVGFVGGASEVYPGAIWPILAGRHLPKKGTPAGRRARREILQALGVDGLPELPTHDANDACVSALLAAAALDEVAGLSVVTLGPPLTVDSDGTLREGPMAMPAVEAPVRQAIDVALRGLISPHG